MSLLRKILRITSYAVFFFTVWFLWPRELDGIAIGRDGKGSVPDYAMKDAHYISVKAGHLEAETHAAEAAFNLTTQRMEAKNVVALLYNASDQRTIVTADQATFHMDERVLHLRDNVQSLSPDGFLLKGPEATYSMNKRVMTASQPIEGETFQRELQVWGDRAEAPLDENKIFLYGNARSLYMEPKHGPTRVRGDSAIVDRAQEKVTYHKNAKVEQEKVVGTGEDADLFYSKELKGVRYMSMTGDVRIEQDGGRYTRSQVAEFFGPTDTIVLSGFPAVYDGKDAVTGDKITVFRATGVVEVTATNAAGAKQKQGAQGKPELTEEDEELIP